MPRPHRVGHGLPVALGAIIGGVMFAAAVHVDLRIPLVNSLKEKRGVLRRIQTGLRKFEVAVAEVDHQNQHRRASLGLATVSSEHFQMQKQLSRIERWLRGQPDIEVLGWDVVWLD